MRPLSRPSPMRRRAVPAQLQKQLRPTIVPAPIKGWRSDRGQATEQPGAATKLINWVCESNAVRMRRGHASHATGLGDVVETLMVHTSGSASKMFGAADDEIFDVTSAGAVGSAAVGSLNSARWSWTNHQTTGGQFLVIANGVDAIRQYNGSAWSAPTITDADGGTFTEEDMIYVWAHKKRLWFIQKTSMKAWYLPVDTIAGAATSFIIGSLFPRGGRLVAGATWSVDSGNGMDDLNVFLTSEGEVAIYSMSDPSDPSTLNLVGVYYVGRPIGDRPFFKIGGELMVITYSGVIPLSKVFKVDQATLDIAAITNPVRDDYAKMAQSYGALSGWQMVTYPNSNIGIVNIPVSADSRYEQFVVNLQSGAWSQWKSIPAVCWALFGENIYFGAPDGKVYKAETGSQDNGQSITAELVTWFSQHGQPARKKLIRHVRPNVQSNQRSSGTVHVIRDFESPESSVDDSAAITAGGAFTWGVSTWGGPDVWGGLSTVKNWRKGGNLGTALAIQHIITSQTSAATVDLVYRVYNYDVTMEFAGIM